jgi:hypothetical protein
LHKEKFQSHGDERRVRRRSKGHSRVQVRVVVEDGAPHIDAQREGPADV